MIKYIAIALIAMIAINGMLAVPRPNEEEEEKKKEDTCSPWLGYVSAIESENNYTKIVLKNILQLHHFFPFTIGVRDECSINKLG